MPLSKYIVDHIDMKYVTSGIDNMTKNTYNKTAHALQY